MGVSYASGHFVKTFQAQKWLWKPGSKSFLLADSLKYKSPPGKNLEKSPLTTKEPALSSTFSTVALALLTGCHFSPSLWLHLLSLYITGKSVKRVTRSFGKAWWEPDQDQERPCVWQTPTPSSKAALILGGWGGEESYCLLDPWAHCSLVLIKYKNESSY